MKKITLILFLIFLGLNNGFSQILDKSYIDNWVLKTFNNSVVDSSTLYVINGYPFEPGMVNTELKKENKLITINLLDNLTTESNDFIPRSSIIILTTGKQAKKNIRKDISKIKKEFKSHQKDMSSQADTIWTQPTLIIDNVKIKQANCYQMINTIKMKDILVFSLNERSISQDIYSANEIDELLIIETK